MPTWNQYFADSFARGNTSAGTAGSTTDVGNGWTDLEGHWRIAGNRAANNHYAQPYTLLGAIYQSTSVTDTKVRVTVSPSGTAETQPQYSALARITPGTNTAYVATYFVVSSTTAYLQLWSIVGGTAVSLYQTPSILTGLDTTANYVLELTAVGVSPTALTVTLYAADGTTVLATHGLSDSTVGLQVPGYAGAGIDNNNGDVFVSNVTLYTGVFGGSVLAQTSATTSSITMGWTASAGATEYDLYGSQTGGFTPAVGNRLYQGASLSFAHTTGTAPGSVWFYALTSTDGSTTYTAVSQAGVQKSAGIVLGCVGDSITAAMKTLTYFSAEWAARVPNVPLAVCLDDGSIPNDGSNGPSNQGISGTTSVTWLPSSANWVDTTNTYANVDTSSGGTTTQHNSYNNALHWFALGGVTHVILDLGVNDSQTAIATSAATYRANIQTIAAGLASHGYTVVLNDPTYVYFIPGVDVAFDDGSGYRVLQYGLQLDAVCNGTTVLRGDHRIAYDYFTTAVGAAQKTDGVHPDDPDGSGGQAALQRIRANALAAALGYVGKPTASGGGGGGGGSGVAPPPAFNGGFN